jgi:hypothetical protein
MQHNPLQTHTVISSRIISGQNTTIRDSLLEPLPNVTLVIVKKGSEVGILMILRYFLQENIVAVI